MKKIGITGQAGFIGTHLFNFLSLKENIHRIPFKDDYFESVELLHNFVKQCDVIVHLAALNRYNDPPVIYDKNICLVKQFINACKATNSKPHILFLHQPRKKRIIFMENQSLMAGNY